MPVLLPEDSNWTVRAERVDAGRVAWLSGPGSRWALLADTHLSLDPETAYDGRRTLDGAQHAAAQAAEAGVDAVIVNGDLAWNRGEMGDYDQVAEVLQPLAARAPVVLSPGNHDRRDHLLRRFLPEAFSLNEPAKLMTVIDAPNVRMILLDSLYLVDVVPGLLGEAQRAWLAGALDAEPDRPTVLFVHHPLGEDDGALLDGDRLLGIVQPRRQVKAVFTAHDHVWRLEQRGRLHVVGMPSTSFPFLPSDGVGWIEAELCGGGARLTVHTDRGDAEHVLDWRP